MNIFSHVVYTHTCVCVYKKSHCGTRWHSCQKPIVKSSTGFSESSWRSRLLECIIPSILDSQHDLQWVTWFSRLQFLSQVKAKDIDPIPWVFPSNHWQRSFYDILRYFYDLQAIVRTDDKSLCCIKFMLYNILCEPKCNPNYYYI